MTKPAPAPSFPKIFSVRTLFIVLGILYALHLIYYYVSFDTDRMFGYLDYQIHWQSQYNLIAGKLLYRDFYWEYGFLPIFLRLPFFFLFGKTFYSNFFNNFVFLPVLGVIISYYIGKQYLNKKALLMFLFLLFLYRTNNDLSSVRHLIPELGLIMAVIGVYEKKHRTQLIGSFLLGISLISSAEYALIANISYVLFYIVYFFTHEKKQAITVFVRTFSFQFIIGFLFIVFLISNNIFSNYLDFHLQFVKSFYINSPDRLVFPRFDNLAEIFSDDKGFIYNIFLFFQRINVYVIGMILLFLIFWNFYNRKSQWFLLNTILIIYSILAYSRTLSTPGYINYGLTFICLLVASIPFQQKTTKWIKITSFVIIIWMCIASGYMQVLYDMGAFIYQEKPTVEKEYLPVAGMQLSKPLVEAYKQVIDYVTSRTTESDYIYTYPDGPYNQLTKRRTPVSVTSISYYGLMPSLADQVRRELAEKKPPYIIVNAFNSFSYYSSINGYDYNVYSSGKNVILDGYVTQVEDYIQQNYEVDKKFPIAWVLKRRSVEQPLQRRYIPVQKKVEWQVMTNKLKNESSLFNDAEKFSVEDTDFKIYFLTDSFKDIQMLNIPIKIDIGIIKSFSKFVYSIGFVTNDNKIYLVKKGFISSDWQDIVLYVPEIDDSVVIKAVMLQVPSNKGFLPFGKPASVEIKSPQAYRLNPIWKIDDSIFKK